MKDIFESIDGPKVDGATLCCILYLNRNGRSCDPVEYTGERFDGEKGQIEYSALRIQYCRSDMDIDEYTKERLWPILVEAVHAMVMYPSHKAYVRDTILPEKPETGSAELVVNLKIPLGEALVILCELKEERRARVSETGGEI